MTATATRKPETGSPQWWEWRARTMPEPWTACAWSRDGQAARHETVRARLDLQHSETVLDWGCGTGEFADQLPGWINYTGYDSCEAMVRRAHLKRPHRRFTADGINGTFDHVVAIGPFNLAFEWSHEQTWQAIDDLWEQARKTLIVSLLRGVDHEDHLAYHHDDLVEFAGKRTRMWAVDGAYLPNDLLLVMRRDA